MADKNTIAKEFKNILEPQLNKLRQSIKNDKIGKQRETANIVLSELAGNSSYQKIIEILTKELINMNENSKSIPVTSGTFLLSGHGSDQNINARMTIFESIQFKYWYLFETDKDFSDNIKAYINNNVRLIQVMGEPGYNAPMSAGPSGRSKWNEILRNKENTEEYSDFEKYFTAAKNAVSYHGSGLTSSESDILTIIYFYKLFNDELNKKADKTIHLDTSRQLQKLLMLQLRAEFNVQFMGGGKDRSNPYVDLMKDDSIWTYKAVSDDSADRWFLLSANDKEEKDMCRAHEGLHIISMRDKNGTEFINELSTSGATFEYNNITGIPKVETGVKSWFNVVKDLFLSDLGKLGDVLANKKEELNPFDITNIMENELLSRALISYVCKLYYSDDKITEENLHKLDIDPTEKPYLSAFIRIMCYLFPKKKEDKDAVGMKHDDDPMLFLSDAILLGYILKIDDYCIIDPLCRPVTKHGKTGPESLIGTKAAVTETLKRQLTQEADPVAVDIKTIIDRLPQIPEEKDE